MTKFRYKALSARGESVFGTMDGDTAQEVLLRLQQEGLIPVEVEPYRKKIMGDFGFSFFFRRSQEPLKDREILWFTQQMARLLNSGFNVDKALQMIAKQNTSALLGKQISSIRLRIKEGKSFSEALEELSSYDSFYIHMVEAGEIAGILPKTMQQIYNFKLKHERLKRKLFSALAYPVVMILTLIATAMVFLFMIIPEFASMYKEMNRELPLITMAVLLISRLFVDYFYVLLLFLVLFVAALKLFGKNEISLWLDQIFIYSSRFTDLYTQIVSERFSRVMGSMIESGIQVFFAMEIAKKTITNHIVREHISAIQIGIQKGNSIASMMWENAIFSEILVQAVDLGEQNGNLGEILLQAADQFEESIEGRMEFFIGVIEPVMTLIVAVFVVIMILAMVLPMMQAPMIT